MKGRCQNPNLPDYKWYGARGIKCCPEWQSFDQFLADMGDKPEGKTLDRINGDGDYEPGNCRWATPKEQTLNRKETVWLTVNGEIKCLSDWARTYSVDKGTISSRLRKGWSDEEAVKTPTCPKETTLLTLDGETKSISDWARAYGLHPMTIHERRKRGWSDEDAVKTPNGNGRPKGSKNKVKLAAVT